MSGTAVPPGNCVTHGYHGRTYCPRCSTSALSPPPLGQAPSAAQNLLLATQSGEYAAGYDAGVQAVWEKWVCSACGFNHDEDESAACEGADVISFADWYGRASDFLRSIREWRGLT